MQKTQLTSIDKTAPYEMPRNKWIIMTVPSNPRRIYKEKVTVTYKSYTREMPIY